MMNNGSNIFYIYHDSHIMCTPQYLNLYIAIRLNESHFVDQVQALHLMLSGVECKFKSLE
jgi:hypothetical protein